RGVCTPPVGPQQLEVLGPGGFQLRFGGQQLIVSGLRIVHASLARQPARARERPFAARVREEDVRCRCAHGAQIYPDRTRWLAARDRPTFLAPWVETSGSAPWASRGDSTRSRS